MLALVVGLRAWFQCKEGLYNYEDYVCVTVDECSSMGEDYHAYKAVGRCIDASIYGENQPSKQEDGSYECEEDFYLKFEYSENNKPNEPYYQRVTCVESEDGCSGLYMLQDKKVCADEEMCSDTSYLSMYPFDDGNTKLCLTSEECVSRKAFVKYYTYDTYECWTKTQCNEYVSYYPYSAVGFCIDATPDNSVAKKEDGYECETGYLYIDSSKSKCVSREDCIKDGALVYDEKKTCIKGNHEYIYFGGYLYRGETGDECMSAEKCLQKGWHPYSDTGSQDFGECLEIEPAFDGDFIERADGVCQCIGYSVSKRTYLDLLLYFGDTARCVSIAKCYFDKHNIYYYGSYGTCASRQDLFDNKQIDYVEIYLEGYSNEGYCPSSATWVDDRFCACPEDMYFFYDSTGKDDSYEKCVQLPQTFDRDHLKLDVHFEYNGKQYVQHQALVTFEQCISGYVREINAYVYGYMTPDEQYCVSECTGIYAPPTDGNRICGCRYGTASDGKTCLSTCDRWTLFVDTEEYCVDECPEDLKPIGSSETSGTCKTCAEATKTADNPDGERPFWDPVAEKCVKICLQELLPTDDGKVCKTCEEANPKKQFFNQMTETCVAACPDNAADEDGVCPKCASGKYLDTENNKCVETCPGTAPVKGEDFVCKICDGGKVYNPMTDTCVQECPTDLGLADGSTTLCKSCEDVNSKNSYFNQMTNECVAACPTELNPADGSKTCTICTGKTPFFDRMTERCVDKCLSILTPDSESKVCKTCAEADSKAALWDQITKECVSTCPYVRPKVENGVCNACPEKTIWKNGECVTCAEANQARPVWDSEKQVCRACRVGDEGSFWDAKEQTCTEKCPQTASIQRVCKKCVEMDSKKPYWDGNKCSECPSAKYWDSNAGNCVSCNDDQVLVDGSCQPKETTKCPEQTVLKDGACVACAASEVFQNGECVCNAEKHITAAEDGSCTACDDALLAYDATSASCLCANGGVLQEKDGHISCDVPCTSNIFSLEEPDRCMDACPQTMTLYPSGDRFFCGACAGYSYYDAALRETSCVSYESCRLGLQMEPRVVYEDGKSARVCAAAPMRASITVGGKELPEVRKAVLHETGSKDYYYTQVGQNVYFSEEDYQTSGTPKVTNALDLINYKGTPKVLTTDGELKDILQTTALTSLRGSVQKYVYADGAQDFGVSITADDEFACDADKNDFCPNKDELKKLNDPVHGVASANAEGLTLRLRSGALYYRKGGEWVKDEEAKEAGVLGEKLYRLFRDGTVEEDDETICEHKETLLVTDDDVLVDGKPLADACPVIRISAGQHLASLGDEPAKTLEESSQEYRRPLLAQKETTQLLGENGCQEGQLVDEKGACVFACPGFVSEDGQRCYSALPAHMKPNGRTAACDGDSGFVLADDKYSCKCKDGYQLSSAGDACVVECALWVKESDEMRCVDECPHWWYTAEDGLCKEEAWRKDTAIAVPIVVVVLVVAVVVAIIIVKKKKGAKDSGKATEMEARDKVTGA